jgi:hypothetical protein
MSLEGGSLVATPRLIKGCHHISSAAITHHQVHILREGDK